MRKKIAKVKERVRRYLSLKSLIALYEAILGKKASPEEQAELQEKYAKNFEKKGSK